MYQLQNRYQDSGWETLDHEKFSSVVVATSRAAILSKNAICYGMVRVVDLSTEVIIVTFSNGEVMTAHGHGPQHPIPWSDPIQPKEHLMEMADLRKEIDKLKELLSASYRAIKDLREERDAVRIALKAFEGPDVGNANRVFEPKQTQECEPSPTVEVEEQPHPYLCVQHGGSPSCEESNLKYGFSCPKCDELKVRELKREATAYLAHTFLKVASYAGMGWDDTCDHEVEHIIDLIVEAAQGNPSQV